MLSYLDTLLLNRVSMYRLVSISLTTLWSLAFVLTLTGTLAYSPLAMVASILVLLAATYLTSRLFGLLFGLRIHGESSYITAFILFFVFTPTLQTTGLVMLMLVGIVAAASKFLLTFRGRHIFNPVAIAAFIMSVSGLGFATWWVASPALIPATFIIGLLVLYKTRRLLMGGTFLSVATPLVILYLMSFGSSFTESLGLLLSWPLLFFSGIMLSEPLTLPPKKWQQVVEAIVVAVLFAIPIHIGEFASNPATALLVGNLIAFGFSHRRAIKLQYKSYRDLTPTITELSFTSPHKLSFEPGQFIELTLPHKHRDLRGMRRVFSIASAPDETTLKLGVKFYNPSSSFKHTLGSLTEGAVLQTTGVSGGFTLPKDPSVPLLLVAGGVGITPYISHLKSLKSRGEKRDITLLYAVTSDKEIAFADFLKTADINVILVVKEGKNIPSKEWDLIESPRITEEIIRNNVTDISARHAYISGPPPMVRSVKQSLKRLKARKIKTDYFTGY
jgi:glycine betaine catabolism B